MKRISLLVAAVVVLGAALPALAEKGKWEVSLQPGYSMIVGDKLERDSVKPGASLKAAGEYWFHEMFSAGLGVGYGFGHKLEGTIFGQDFTTDIRTKTLMVGPFIKAGKMIETGSFRWMPYALLEAGLSHTFPFSGTFTFTRNNSTVSVSEAAEDKFAFGVAVGATVPIHESWRLGVELNFVDVVKSGKDPIQALDPCLRIGYVF